MDLSRFLNYGLSAVLVFVGGKMIAEAAHHTEWLAEIGGWDAHAQGHLYRHGVFIVIISLIGTSVAFVLFPGTKKTEEHSNASSRTHKFLNGSPTDTPKEHHTQPTTLASSWPFKMSTIVVRFHKETHAMQPCDATGIASSRERARPYRN